nr:HepT-like ribonuclease domain-containing protein [Tomitella gaofuii]
MAYDAVLHNLMLIGEAANSIREDLSTALPGTPWHSIIGLRNIVAHEYFRVRPDLIADIVDNDLRSLAIGLRRLLDD